MKKHVLEDLLIRSKKDVLRLLNVRLRSEKEIRDRLKEKKFEDGIIEQTIQYFKDQELINDRQFAKAWISSRLKKPFGSNRIRFELNQKGIKKDILEEELIHATYQFPEENIVKQLAKTRASKYTNIEPVKIKQRVYGYLLRRGFSQKAIDRAISGL